MDAVPDLILVRDADRLGLSRPAIFRQAAAGTLTRIHPGVYVVAATWQTLRPEVQLAARVRAADACLRRGAVYAAESAAVLQGIPLLGRLPDRPHIVVGETGARSTRTVRRTARVLGPADVTDVDRLLVTTPAETAIDIAAARTPLGGVLAFAHVRNRCGVGIAELEARLEARGAFRGRRQAARALATSIDACESPLEALVLSRCDDLGFAPPEQQRAISTGAGTYRVDFAWDDGQLILEADGAAKYLAPELLAGRTASDVVYSEKLREDSIREVVKGFQRTTWEEAMAGEPLRRRLERLGVPRIRQARTLRR